MQQLLSLLKHQLISHFCLELIDDDCLFPYHRTRGKFSFSLSLSLSILPSSLSLLTHSLLPSYLCMSLSLLISSLAKQLHFNYICLGHFINQAHRMPHSLNTFKWSTWIHTRIHEYTYECSHKHTQKWHLWNWNRNYAYKLQHFLLLTQTYRLICLSFNIIIYYATYNTCNTWLSSLFQFLA